MPQSSMLSSDELDAMLSYLRMSSAPAHAIRRMHHKASGSQSRRELLMARYGQIFQGSIVDLHQSGDAPAPAKSYAQIDALACLQKMPQTLTWYAQQGIPSEVAAATLSDLEIWMHDYFRQSGQWGLTEAAWVAMGFACKVFRLGRLQFEPATFDTSMFVETAPFPLTHGDLVLNVHIPACGPMSPKACDDSFRRATQFFNRYFAGRSFKAFVCSSWLLDQQLTEYLAEDTNIVHFLRRFEPLVLKDNSDAQTIQRVFGQYPINLDQAPRDTTLRRIVIKHIQNGGQWRMGSGYMLCPND